MVLYLQSSRCKFSIQFTHPHSCWRSRRPYGRQSTIHATAAQYNGPPAAYDHTEQSYSTSLAIVQQRYPQLVDLVQQGNLVVVPRSALYRERRADGYREPEEVFVVGTSHMSSQSADDVRRVIEAIRPQNVVVELCKSRSAVMYADAIAQKEGGADSGGEGASKASNIFSLSGTSLPGAMQRSLALGGQSALVLRLAMASLVRRVGRQLAVQPGAEFVAARRAADAIDAQVVLGDRPIEITLGRAWRALRVPQRVQLLWVLVSSMWTPLPVVSMEEVERLREDDMVNAFFTGVGQRFPEVMLSLIHERDLYLAWSLKRSKAVNGCERVVGVMGKGHMRGVVYALTHNPGELRFKDLVNRDDGPPLVQRIAVEVVLALAGWAAWVAFFEH